MKKSSINATINNTYIQANTELVSNILKLQKAVVELVRQQENTSGFQDVYDNILDPCIQIMKEVAEKHEGFIMANKNGQIESVKSSKASDAFNLGADMLTRIKIAANGGTIQGRLIHQFPVQPVDSENVRSGGMYTMFNRDRHEVKRQTLDIINDQDVYQEIGRTGQVTEYDAPPSKESLTPFYNNIMGSSLVTAYQAMLITMYARLKHINIVEEYPRLLNELKRENILDIHQDVNVILQPIKNPKGKSPLSLEDPSLMAVLTALYEFGGTRNTDDLNTGKKIMDCSQFVERVFNSKTVTTGMIVRDIEKLQNGEVESVKKSEVGEILKQTDRIVHYDMKNAVSAERKYRLDRLMQDLEAGDVVVWAGHVGFISVENGEKKLLSYTRNRGEAQEATVSTRTFNHFSEYSDFDKMAMHTSNIDGLTKYSQTSFARLASLKDLYVIKFPEQIKLDDGIPDVENVKSPKPAIQRRRPSVEGFSL